MKKICKIVALAFVFTYIFSICAAAANTPYTTYTYDIYGNPLESPDAYVPDKKITNYDMNMETALSSPQDIFVDKNSNIYIADTGNKRVVVCNSDFVYQFEITTFLNAQGVPDELSDPRGLFVTDKNIYVCDTSKARIVIFDLNGNFEKIIYSPEASIMGTDTLFRPISVAVDGAGRMYVVSNQTYSGIFAYDENANFQGFIGSQKTSISLAAKIRKFFFPDLITEDEVTIGYLSCTVDDAGFVWATVDTTQNTSVFESAVRSFNEDYAPVKKLNVAGNDVMVRSGFFMPAGEVSFISENYTDSSTTGGVSKLVDIALGPNGMWIVVDSKRSKIYAYDQNGVLLFIFGDQGKQLGNLSNPTAITFFDDYIYVLDAGLGAVISYKRTEYGDTINQALYDDTNRNYSAALDDWQAILSANVNNDSAYVGVGNNLLRNGKYTEALRYFKAASDTKDYSDAYKQVRKEWIGKYIWVIPIVVVALVFLLVKALKYVHKKNKAGMTKVGKRTFGEEILYGFYVIIHPFDGFWDLKHEKRGSVRGGIFWLAMATFAYVYSVVGASWMSNPDKEYANAFYLISTVIIPVFLWVVGNWCLTTLFDGEGNFKNIFIATTYSLVPLVILLIPSALLTNILSLDEIAVSSLLSTLALIWVFFLLFFGTMTTHGYSMGKNFVITIFTVVGMIFIAFLIVLFSNLVTRMVGFIGDIATEITYRSYS